VHILRKIFYNYYHFVSIGNFIFHWQCFCGIDDMSSALFIVLEREIPEFDSFVNGKAISNAEPDLAKIAADSGFQSLIDFFSVESAMVEYFFEEEEFENHTFPVPEIQWYEASEGLVTIEGLLDYLKHHPNTLHKADEVIADLQDFARVLKKAEQHRIRWYLSIDF
jgi:hypothetical protein